MEHNISEEHLKQAVDKMGKEPATPIGQCFEATLHAYWQLRKWELRGKIKDLLLVHGAGIANMPGQEGKTIVHAWLTFHTNDQEDLIAYEPTWSVFTTHDKVMADLQVSYCKKYNYEELKNEIIKNDNIDIGPWDPKILEILKVENGYLK